MITPKPCMHEARIIPFLEVARRNYIRSIHANAYNSEEFFTEELWNKISETSKKHLRENDFVFPENNLGKEYIFERSKYIIDTTSRLNYLGAFFGQNYHNLTFLEFRVVGTVKNMLKKFKNDQKEGFTTLSYKETPDEILCQDYCQNCSEVIAAKITDRLVDCFPGKDGCIYMATKLINGVSLKDYSWKKHAVTLSKAIEIALAYLNQLQFLYKLNLNHLDRNCTVMIDSKKEEVIMSDFSEAELDQITKKFIPNEFGKYVSIIDVNRLLKILPSQKDIERAEYKEFHKYIVNLMNDKHQKNSSYINVKISELKVKINNFWNDLHNSYKNEWQNS